MTMQIEKQTVNNTVANESADVKIRKDNLNYLFSFTHLYKLLLIEPV